MTSIKVTVVYRDDTTPPDTFHCERIVTAECPTAVAVHQSLSSYGQKRITWIPWDRIREIEAESG